MSLCAAPGEAISGRWGARWPRTAALLAILAVTSLPAGTALADDEDPAPAVPAAKPPSAPAPEDEVPPSLNERVREAVERGVQWLRKKAPPSGNWGALTRPNEETYSGERNAYPSPYGTTSLALYTLMKCGVPSDDPQVRAGLAWLRKQKDGGSAYEIAMELLAVTATADPFKRTSDAEAAGERVHLAGDNRAWAETLVTNLMKRRGTLGWRYWGKEDKNKGGNQDLSSTQLAVLALFAAERCGLRVDAKVWSDAITFALENQEEDGPARRRAVIQRPPVAKRGAAPNPGGTSATPASDGGDGDLPDRARGFAYLRRMGPDEADRTASSAMTACGLGVVAMARFSLMSRSPKTWAKVDAAKVQASVYDGLAWLDANWSAFENRGSRYWHLYHVYCVERAMDLIGSQRLGERLWYVEMAQAVVERQKSDGSWQGGAGTTFNADVLDTCFALLFLRRATRGGIPFPSVTGGSEAPVDGR